MSRKLKNETVDSNQSDKPERRISIVDLKKYLMKNQNAIKNRMEVKKSPDLQTLSTSNSHHSKDSNTGSSAKSIPSYTMNDTNEKLSQFDSIETNPSRNNTGRPVLELTEKVPAVIVRGQCYLKCHVIGRGGFSKVYKVIRKSDATCHALKISHVDSAEKNEIARNEIQLLSKFKSSPYIINMRDFELIHSRYYIVMELGDFSLDQYIKHRISVLTNSGQIKNSDNSLRNIASNASEQSRKPTFPFLEMLTIWHQIVMAVKEIHSFKIVHSDLKPSNFIYIACTNRIKLIDFGVSRVLAYDQTSIAREDQVGTLSYISPEALTHGHGRSRIGSKTDVWSLGCILYLLIYAVLPYHSVLPKLKIQYICDPKQNIDFPNITHEELLKMVKGCLVKDRKLRLGVDDILKFEILKGVEQDVYLQLNNFYSEHKAAN
ncbi:Dual specificity protein kinase Ttk [Thelohanellus kitauei]|uniref:Dual specificity protein kinase Ttk n=1 Tax=Thelohanellus kitauei TaxID=669202 RepID=A0A0C2J1C7_THEKT|nr:Dual specificity protein kinase Ttk [Thelohanellus kitauei]